MLNSFLSIQYQTGDINCCYRIMAKETKHTKLDSEQCYVKYTSSKTRIFLIVGGVLAFVILVIVLAVVLSPSEEKIQPFIRSLPKDAIFTHGAVASGSGTCSEIGRNILKEYGTAMDAAVATEFCLGVMISHSTGIGGGGFALVYKNATGKVTAYNFREKAPIGASRDMYLNPRKSSTRGGLSTAVPGFVKGLYEAWRLHGRLPWKRLLQPSIDLATNGFVFSYALYDTVVKTRSFIHKDPGLRELFFDSDGNIKREGERIKDLKLAETMKEIARDPNSFYTGKLAKAVALDIQEAGGIVTEQDLKDYTAEQTKPIAVKIGNRELLAMRPPSSGAVVAMILNILQGYNLDPADLDNPTKAPLTYHRIAEAFKFAYAYRSMLGDDTFVNNSVVETDMLKADKTELIRKKILDDKTYKNESFYGGFYATPDHGTSHSSFISDNGDAVSLTSTINLYFGGAYRSRRTGIIYNDEMDDFSTPGQANAFGYEPSPNNFIEPGKRPMSSMSPIIVLDDKKQVKIVSGASGGSRIISGTAQTVINALWFNRTAWDAVTLPRIHHQLLPNTVLYSLMKHYKMPDYILDGLRARGHKVTARSTQLCNTQTITKYDDGKIYAKSDPRKAGAWAAGY